MVAARLATLLLAVLPATLIAQNSSRSQVVITVVDANGAVIPGVHIGIVWLPSVPTNGKDWLNYALHAPEQVSAQTDAYGEATVGLAKGSYAISILALGFPHYFKRVEIRDESSQSHRVTLVSRGRSDCIACGAAQPEIPMQRGSLNIFIPLEPLQMMTLTAVRIRRR